MKEQKIIMSDSPEAAQRVTVTGWVGGGGFYGDGEANERGMLRLWPSKGFKNDGSLRWAVSYRPRESRDTFTYGVIPCCGLEEAQEKTKQILRGQVDKMMALEPAYRHSVDSLIRNCNQYRVEVPGELLNTQAEKLREQLERERAELLTKLANVDTRLGAIPAGAAA